MTEELRYRERGTLQSYSAPVGRLFFKNQRNGYELTGTPPVVTQSPGVLEKCFDASHGRPPYKSGGPFFLIRITNPTSVAGSGRIFPATAVSLNDTQLKNLGYPFKTVAQDFWQDGYEGPFFHSALPDVVAIPGQDIKGPDDYRYSRLNPDDLPNLGARAYTRLRPKPAVADLGQAIAEADDIPRMLKTTVGGVLDLSKLADPKSWEGLRARSLGHSRNWEGMGGKYAGTMLPKKVGDQFLNTVFGWKPFVKDISDTYNLVTKYYDHLDRMYKRNDRWRQRRFSEDEVLEESVVFRQDLKKDQVGFRTYIAPTIGVAQCSRVQMTVKRQRMARIWYEGSFRQYLPEFDLSVRMNDQVRQAKQFLDLAGLNINPTLVYKVTPWTWLLDWGVNAGDNIQVAQDYLDDSVVSRYMYLMRETFDRYEYVSEHVFPSSTITLTSYQEVRVKRRVAAGSNFGFTLLPGGLSGMQLGILGALGLSRGGGVGSAHGR